ncbi:MerR family transcriptional regulator [Microbacterium rhizophilus]|uniref:MerR family transcriptional regulator n=1 Tax=Microbacterium rhizophilus TaxID=3138934 RepID=UPI0031F07AF1
MRIGELSERTGASVRSLRYYEQQGLMTSERTPSGQRTFHADAVERVRLIQLLLAAGLSSPRILEMMPCIHSGTTTRAQRRMLEGERLRIEERIAELESARERLSRVIRIARERDEERAPAA